MPGFFNPIVELLGKGLDKIFPDADKRAEAKIKLAELAERGELTELEKRYEAIVAEATSSDPWTSRARPSFMYVFYLLILLGPVMGIVYAVQPDIASDITTGFQGWFKAIPDEVYLLFGSGYLGYGYYRTREKEKGVAK